MQSGFEKWSVYQAQRIAVLPKGCWSCIHAKSRSQHGETGSVGMLTVLFVNIWVCIVGGNRCLYIYWQVAHVLFCNIFSFIYAAVMKWKLNFNTIYFRDLRPWYTEHFSTKTVHIPIQRSFHPRVKRTKHKITNYVLVYSKWLWNTKILIYTYHRKKMRPCSWSLEIKYFI